jgi:Tfp pilus assembly protein PilN
VRPVNLIPKEQQSHGLGAGRTGLAPYLVLGFLGLAVIGMSAVVLTSNKVNSKQEEIAQLESDAARAKASADALRPYGNFAQVEQARVDTVNSLLDTSFNWERVLRSLSRVIPSNVWLTTFAGTVSPDVKVEGEAGGSGGSRGETKSPAIQLSGCTYSHSAVARMMVAMRNIDNVSEVVLESSEKLESASAQESAGGGGQGAGGGGGGDCRTNRRITKFEILVVLGHDKTQSAAAAAGSAGASSDPVAAAQGAAATASNTSSAGATE